MTNMPAPTATESSSQTGNNNNNLLLIIIILIAILLAIFGLLYFYLPDRNSSSGSNNPLPSPALTRGSDHRETAEPDPVLKANSVIARDSSIGTETTIQQVELAKSGFVVIYTDNSGNPGSIIGQSAVLSPGIHENILVSLNQATQHTDILYAVLHSDNGDGQFDSQTDPQIVNQQNQPVMMQYVVGTIFEGYEGGT